MPKANEPREITARGEANLARRIEFQREDRGWSYETLAKEMRAVGCPIQASALYRIEKGDPPRKITVDELLALAQVFGIDDVNEMVRPMEDVLNREANRLVLEMELAAKTIYLGIKQVIANQAELTLLMAKSEKGSEASDYVLNVLGSLFSKRRNTYLYPDDEVGRLADQFLTSAIKLAGQLSDARADQERVGATREEPKP